MKKLMQLFAITIMILVSGSAINAQSSEKTTGPTYLLPDGTVFDIAKLDSLTKAWGEGKVMMVKNKKDQGKTLVYLVRVTDEVEAEMEQAEAARQMAFREMLDKPAPDFSLKDLQGKSWSLKELRGKIVVLNFWFTSCAPCIQELPELNQLVTAYSAKDIVFLGLTYNDAAQVNTFLEKRKFNYTLLPNSSITDGAYHITSWPTSIVIDRQGIIKKITGYSPRIFDELSAVIKSLH